MDIQYGMMVWYGIMHVIVSVHLPLIRGTVGFSMYLNYLFDIYLCTIYVKRVESIDKDMSTGKRFIYPHKKRRCDSIDMRR